MTVSFHQIITSEDQWWSYGCSLLVQSFPETERRDLVQIEQYLGTKENFWLFVILKDENPCGVLIAWDLPGFIFIEHFAIDPNYRNQGLGTFCLQELVHSWKKPIVLEVEYPDDDLSRRRINFYTRMQFLLWNKIYFQPPYRSGDCSIPMKLMVTDSFSEEENFETICSTIYSNVYPLVF